MIHTFTYNNVFTEIDTVKKTIKFKTPNFTNLDTVWVCDWVETELNSSAIIVKPKTHQEDNGLMVPKTSIKYPKIPARLFNNEVITLTGAGQFDFFAGLTNQPISIAEIFARALINNQLENLIDIYGKTLACFNPYNNWDFFLPIEASVAAERVLSETTITVTMVTASTFEYKLMDSVGATIIDWQASPVFVGDYVGDYLVQVRSTVDSGQDVLPITVVEPEI